MKKETLLDKDGSNNLTICKIICPFLQENLCQYCTAAMSNSSDVKLWT